MRKTILGTVNLVIALLIITAGVHADTVSKARVDIVRAGESYSNIYKHVWHAVLEEAGIEAEVLAPPHKRKRHMFAEGKLVLDCCAAVIWRDQPAEKEVQYFTHPLSTMRERFVFKAGRVKPISLEDLGKYRFAVVRGFSYTFEDRFGDRVDADDQEGVLALVEAGRADVAIMDEREFEFFMRENPMELELGDTFFVGSIRARVHKARADLLPRINQAIEKLQADGRIEEIVRSRSQASMLAMGDG